MIIIVSWGSRGVTLCWSGSALMAMARGTSSRSVLSSVGERVDMFETCCILVVAAARSVLAMAMEMSELSNIV